MLRYLVRARPPWPGSSSRLAMQPPRVAAQQAASVRCKPFHSTAPSSIGFKNFKNSPRPKWKTQQQLDAKNAEILAERPPHPSYAEALKSHQPRAWIGARKKIVWGRLFGPSSASGSTQGQ